MNQRRIIKRGHVHTGSTQFFTILQSFVTQRIRGGDQNSRWQTRQIRVAQRREPVIFHQRRIRHEVAAEPGQQRLIQTKALPQRLDGIMPHRRIRGGINQYL